MFLEETNFDTKRRLDERSCDMLIALEPCRTKRTPVSQTVGLFPTAMEILALG